MKHIEYTIAMPIPERQPVYMLLAINEVKLSRRRDLVGVVRPMGGGGVQLGGPRWDQWAVRGLCGKEGQYWGPLHRVPTYRRHAHPRHRQTNKKRLTNSGIVLTSGTA